MIQKIFKLIFSIIIGIINILNLFNISYPKNEIISLDENDSISEKINIEEFDNPNMSIDYQEDQYIATISIPKINLNKKLYSIGSDKNTVDKNIEILKESTMPNEENSNLILAAHSGSSKVAFFNNLKKLVNDDIVYIYYDDIKYTYYVYNIVEVIKDGKIVITRNTKDNYLTLITCKVGTNKQYVIICKLKSKEKI